MAHDLRLTRRGVLQRAGWIIAAASVIGTAVRAAERPTVIGPNGGVSACYAMAY